MSLNGFERLFCVSQGIPRQGRNNIGIWICHKNSYVIGLAGIYIYLYIFFTHRTLSSLEIESIQLLGGRGFSDVFVRMSLHRCFSFADQTMFCDLRIAHPSCGSYAAAEGHGPS